jgi:Protein of unknown function (DUF3703)
MEYLVGVALALGAGVFTTIAGFDRDRSLYPVILLVIASYYILFAIIGDGAALGWETGIFAAFAIAATAGFRTNLWIVVVAMIGHGLLDWYRDQLIDNAGVPGWWPMFCLSFDGAAGAYLAWRLLARKIEATNASSFGRRILPDVDTQLTAAKAAEVGGNPTAGFRFLERAHVLDQRSTLQHVRVHMHMLMWGMRHDDLRAVVGQAVCPTPGGLCVPTMSASAATPKDLAPQMIDNAPSRHPRRLLHTVGVARDRHPLPR